MENGCMDGWMNFMGPLTVYGTFNSPNKEQQPHPAYWHNKQNIGKVNFAYETVNPFNKYSNDGATMFAVYVLLKI